MFEIVAFIIVFSIVGFISHETGVANENNRIYEQCIKNNSDLTVTKATEICKEIVK